MLRHGQWADPIPPNGTRVPASYDYTGAVTGATVKAPSSGKRLVFFSAIYSATAAHTFTLFFNTNGDTASDGSGRVDKQSPDGSGWAGNPSWPGRREGPIDGVLRITTTAAGGSVHFGDMYEV